MWRHDFFIGTYCTRCIMSNATTGLKAALAREVSKLARQEDAIEATKAMIALCEAQIDLAEKRK